MKSRTYGWVQNPSDFGKLKLVVQIFDSSSEHYERLKTVLIPNYISFDELKSNLLHKLNNKIEEFFYSELVGTSKDINGNPTKKRGDAVADGLIQITILPQSAKTKGKQWTDNWSSDGYLRWALSLNFVKHDRETDICSITTLGKQFSESEKNSEAETKILQDALLRYPPATQVLNILENSSKPITKKGLLLLVLKLGNRVPLQLVNY